MGACYSKNGANASLSPQEKAPTIRKRLSWRSKKQRYCEDSLVAKEIESLVEVPPSPEKFVVLTASELSSVGIDPILAEKEGDEERESKTGISSPLQATVAPSDSGIESIGTVQEDGQDQQMSHLPSVETVGVKLRRKDHKTAAVGRAEESDSSSGDETSVYLSRQLQRLSRGSCHKCGNFKLDDSALTALLADSYCICGPRRAGRPSINPQCQTHGLRHQRSTTVQVDTMEKGVVYSSTEDQPSTDKIPKLSLCSNFTEMNKKSIENLPRKSSLKKGLSSELLGEGRSLRVSIKSEDDSAVVSALAHKNSFDDVFEDESGGDGESNQAFWANSGSIDKNLDGFSLLAQHRKSLLSEILDITDSICHCDFYSNEIYCSPQDQQDLNEDISKSVQCVTSASIAQHQFSDETISKSTPVLYPQFIKKCHSSSKNVSFARENVSRSFATPEASRPEPSLSKSSQQNGKLERLSLLESNEGLVVSGSSSEEDMANIAELLNDGNVDVAMASSTRRSFSYSSVQQLVESSRELTGPMSSARRMLIDGCDSVVIPTEVYLQLEADLSTMKEQLQFLTSLMLEEQDEDTTLYETDEHEESFA
ncbi:hypothetical protein ElyMa_006626300 [Elysia marginata]|uniref:Uncharacterized protein n=1 Tax=Elysia marginata TaxID=1093978 RepID=A0AAV4IHK9_9GAST|nr:hypothetical protein ElyMa_006626300 [Elysia marginata]